MSDNACCFCGDDVGRYGHNPAPVSDTGRCCDVCNQMVVIPARMSMLGLRSEGYHPNIYGRGRAIKHDIADKILTDTYGEWWVWSGNEPVDDPDNWNYIHDGAEGLYLGVHEYVSFLSGDDYDEVPITNLTEDNKEEIKDFLGFAAETILPGNITDIIMDEYLEQGESYEDAQEYARAATEKLKLDAEGRKPYTRS